MHRTEWTVVTAGPSAGKTSTLRALAALGYRTAPEAARLVIDQKVSEGHDPDELREEIDFQTVVEEHCKFIEWSLDPRQTVFLDRSLADNIAYRRHAGMDVPDRLVARCDGRYANVVLLDRLDFEDDYARDEDEDEAAELHAEIRQAYEDLGHDPIEVPVMPVDERVGFILGAIE